MSLNVPLLSSKAKPLLLSRSGRDMLDAFQKSALLKKNELLFCQARLLIAAETKEGWTACQYCGQCMSGCVYGSIYKAGDDILAMRDRGEIDYVPGCLVERLSEEGERVKVRFFDGEGKSQERTFDRVFLAAGAVNSTRIVMNSLGLDKEKASLKSRGGFVLPALSFRELAPNWPQCNTEPGLFLEFKGGGLDHWVHVQISTDNELLPQKLGLREGDKGILAWLKRFVISHLFLVFVNYHSDHSGTYDLFLEKATDPSGLNRLRTVHHKTFPQWKVLWATATRLLGIFGRIGCLPLLPLAKLNSGSYHVGGTLPMKKAPQGKLDTDLLGRVGSWKKVHVVDSAVFPSLPGTTIGLLLMANAYRVADQVMGQREP